jgi:diacylglycerol kinase (ATP)
MKVAPEACLDDGLLDVVVIPGVSRARLLRELPGIYRGKHLGVDVVSLHRGAHIEATAQPATVRLEVDGEPLGFLPVVVDALPGALSIVGATG